MNSVRFGRALGLGVREAAKAAVKAAEAAAAPASGGTTGTGGDHAARSVARQAVRVTEATAKLKGLKEGGRRFGEATLKPVARAGGVLWHEVMGVLFGLFVLVAGMEAWRGRGALRGGAGRGNECFALGMVLVFGYFMGMSFVRASRRGKR